MYLSVCSVRDTAELIESYRTVMVNLMKETTTAVRSTDDASRLEVLGSNEWLTRCLEVERRKGTAHLRLRADRLEIVLKTLRPLLNSTERETLADHAPDDLIDMMFERALDVLCVAPSFEGEKGRHDDWDASFDRPRLDTFHQLPCTRGTTVRRVQLMRQQWMGADPPETMFLGDDDFVSLQLAHQLQWGSTVLDADRAVLHALAAHVTSLAVPVRLMKHDLRQPPPSTKCGRFDFVCADPPYSVEGLRLFVGAAAQVINRKPTSRFFLSLDPLVLEERRLLAVMGQHRFRMVQRIRRMNWYVLPENRRRRLQWIGRLFGANPFIRALIDLPMTCSDMFVFQIE